MPTKYDDRVSSDRSLDSKERKKHRVKVVKTKSGDKIRKSSLERGYDKAKERDRSENSTSERGSVAGSSSTNSKRRVSAPVKEFTRQSSLNSMEGSRISLPYPAFSKAHSREAVGSKESIESPSSRPDSVERTEGKTKSRKRAEKIGEDNSDTPQNLNGPATVSDELSALEEKKQKLEKQSEELTQRLVNARRETRTPPRRDVKVSKGSLRETKSSGLRENLPRRTASYNHVRSKGYRYRPGGDDDDDSSLHSDSRSSSPASRHTDSVTKPTVASSVDSGATQKATRQVQGRVHYNRGIGDEGGLSGDSTPRGASRNARRKESTTFETLVADSAVFHQIPPVTVANAPPPPPPPPPVMGTRPPRVDYLMQNGGLAHKVPKRYLDAIEMESNRSFSYGELPDSNLMHQQVETYFRPLSNLLDDYQKIMAHNGSIAVGTGYRSIARRLLDRLEAVFARDISSETCDCAMCQHDFPPDQDRLDSTGISWGEILEYVSGRRELPPWPPFAITESLDPNTVGLGILETPMQKLDIDVPEEYRDHYIKQSKKTKSSVDKWLAGQAVAHAAPDEADNDTLTFAMLTRLDEIQRPYFKKLLGVSDTRPPSVQPTANRSEKSLNAPESTLIRRTGFALQRLYRLTNQPRAPECACYLVVNPQMHNILATLAAVSDHEWDVLTSGRFDGFLWSGADDQVPSVPPSSGPTPAGVSTWRAAIPLSRPITPMTTGTSSANGAPVALDEETEIIVLAEVERDIYLGMEALEDAFEELHNRAEQVRGVMRARQAGLAMAQAARRGASGDAIEARLGTPASNMGTPNRGQWDGNGAGEAYHGDLNDDGVSVFGVDWKSELAPDDSASNISGVRKFRRKKRIEERKTPAPIEEEDEQDHNRYKARDKHGRRRL